MAEVIDRGLVLHIESEALTLKSGLVNEHTGISLQARESAHDVFVHTLNFSDGSRVLQGLNGLLLDSENDTIVSFQTNGCRTTIDSLKSVLNLEDFAIRSEDADRFVVLSHNY